MFDLKKCELCPRRCGIDRHTERGACRMGAELQIARAALHFWEEPPISGSRGSGTVFFAGCNLGCVYCQNYEISRGGEWQKVSPAALADIFTALEQKGAHNINLVTPTHYMLPIREALGLWRQRGGSLPVVYNTGGYERAEAIAFLGEDVDIYLTDLKYAESASAAQYSAAPDYPEVAWEALREMVRQKGAPRFDAAGILQQGVIVRLLILPSLEYEAMLNLSRLRAEFGDQIILSIMNQYTPIGKGLPPELRQRVAPASYQTIADYAAAQGWRYAYLQDGSAAEECYIPEFGGKI